MIWITKPKTYLSYKRDSFKIAWCCHSQNILLNLLLLILKTYQMTFIES